MKLATLKNATRDGQLVLVSRDLSRCSAVPHIADTLQQALDDWAHTAPELQAEYLALNAGRRDSKPFDTHHCAAPLPRAYQWLDGSAYLSHVELVRRARGAGMPPEFWVDPLMYQGGSDELLGPTDPITAPDAEMGIDLEAEIAVITTDVPLGTRPEQALSHVALVGLVNDVTLRNLVPADLAKGFGFLLSKPASALSPVFVTPDELGEAWHSGRLHLPLRAFVNGMLLGQPNGGVDMQFGFDQLIAHVARTRRLGAGTLLGSGTVSNRDPAAGVCCLSEKRVREQLDGITPQTPWLQPGDRVRIDMLDALGHSLFGAIDQQVHVLNHAP